MMKHILAVILFLSCLSVKSQNVGWFVSAHAGAGSFKSASMNGSVLAGFQNSSGQQFAIGPVIKSFNMEGVMTNMIGARAYSQMPISERLGVYIQADFSNGNSMAMVSMSSPLRLETGMGLNVMLKENFGVGCGYTFGEYNPFTSQRNGTPAIKLVYSFSFSSNNGW